MHLSRWNGELYSQGLGYISAILKEHGHTVRCFSLADHHEDMQTLCECIINDQPGLIGFSSTTFQFGNLKNIIAEIRKRSEAFIVCGGVHPTVRPECIEEIPELNAIVRGEGEFPMLELADALRDGSDYRTIQNLWVRDEASIIRNPMRPPISDLDILPFPDTTWVNGNDNHKRRSGVNTFIFSRGCVFDCSYCSNKVMRDIYAPHIYFRQRSPEKAIQEIELRAQRYDLSWIRFDDDLMTINETWFREFFCLYKKRIHIPFRCNLRSGCVTEAMVQTLKDAGAVGFITGVEHGNEAFRKEILKRDVANDAIIETFAYFKKYNISSRAHVMVGLPDETKELFFDTVRLCRQLSLVHNQSISIFAPYPGTALGDMCEQNGLIADTQQFRERQEAVIDFPSFSKKEIQACYELFPLLLKYPQIPLWTPLWVMSFVLACSRRIGAMRIFFRALICAKSEQKTFI